MYSKMARNIVVRVVFVAMLFLLMTGVTVPFPNSMNMKFVENDFDDYLSILKLDAQEAISYLSHKWKSMDNVGDWVSCDACKVIFNALKLLVDRNVTEEEATVLVAGACTALGIYQESICYSAIYNFLPEIRDAYTRIENNLSVSNICAFVVGGSCLNLDEYLSVFDWSVAIPSPEPPYVPPPQPNPTAPKIRILHVSDSHLDDYYVEGSVSNCNEPVCCRPNQNAPPDRVPTYAGKYGSFDGNCEIPQIVFESLLDFALNLQVDLFYYTGDITPSDVWNQTKARNIQRIQVTSGLIRERFTADNVVFFTPGNHESTPCDSYPVPPAYDDYDIAYLYTQLDSIWTNFTPNINHSTILKGGYFAFDVKPGLRVISLNTNYAHDRNVWLLVQSQDPTEQLQWLIGQLEDAEKNNIKVHIIGHIPPGKFTYVWSRNYRDVLDRYKGTVVGQFFGHTHHDEFEMIYDDVNTSYPISVVHVAPSVTTGSQTNPAFRVYTIDGDYPGTTWQVLDYEEYWLDVNRANADGFPTWELLNTAKSGYGMPDLTPASFNDLIERMETDDSLLQKFYQNSNRMIPKPPCEGGCKTDFLCNLRRGWSGYNTTDCPI